MRLCPSIFFSISTFLPDMVQHYRVVEHALDNKDMEYLVKLRDTRMDPFNDATLTFLGPSKRVATLWPHCLNSAVSKRNSRKSRETVNHLLRMLESKGNCPTCGNAPLSHKVHEVQLMDYVDAGAWSPVHQDSPLEDDLVVAQKVPLERQGALICMLERCCQGGILHISNNLHGRIAHYHESGEPLDLLRDAVPIHLMNGDVCMFANVEHMVTRLESGTRLVMSVRISCPTRQCRGRRLRRTR